MRSHGPHISTRFADQEASVHPRLASSHRSEETEMDLLLPEELFEQQCSGYKDVYHDLEHMEHPLLQHLGQQRPALQ